MRLRSPAAAVLLATSPVWAGSDLLECSARQSARDRADCRERWAGEVGFDWRAWRDLDRQVAADPAAAIEVLEALDDSGAADRLDVRGRARLADTRGQALAAVGRRAEAAAAYDEALRLDPGTVALTCASATAGPRSIEIDAGAGRLERAAAAFAAIGRHEDAQRWLDRARELGAAPEPGAARAVLSAPQWFPRLPAIELTTLAGQTVSLPREGPKAAVLSFWASWCVPCMEELPKLQALWRESRDAGLEVVAINVDEPESTVRMFAEATGLELPIALSSPPLTEDLAVRGLPSLIVVDRLGRIRRRWDGYDRKLEQQLGALIQELLDDGRAVPHVEVAEVLTGRDRVEPLFSVEFPGRVEGFVPVGPGEIDPEARALAIVASNLAVIASDGGVLRRHDVGRGPGLLRRADLDGDGVPELLAFRRGATEVALLDVDGAAPQVWTAPAPVIDLELEPAHGERPGAVWLGTTGGVFRAGIHGAPFEAVDGLAGVLDLSLEPDGAFALDARGHLVSLDASRVATSVLEHAGSSSLLQLGVAGAPPALAPPEVTAAATLRAGEDAWTAVATSTGQLVVLDRAASAVFRARWDDIELMGTADLDRDGAPELFVGAGRRLVALRLRP